jgi:3-hydroxyisobutyrate dehydrogenase-like beta-hydroxyacid dehydrogenase
VSCRALAKDDAYVADTPADAARGAGIVVTMLADEDGVIAAMDGPDGALEVMASPNRSDSGGTGEPMAPQHPLWVQRTIWVGEAGAGTRLKLVTNSWVLAVVEAGAETIALAEGLGLDPGLFFQALEGGPLDLPYLRMKGKAMTERDFTPRSGSSSPRRTPNWCARRRKTAAWTSR